MLAFLASEQKNNSLLDNVSPSQRNWKDAFSEQNGPYCLGLSSHEFQRSSGKYTYQVGVSAARQENKKKHPKRHFSLFQAQLPSQLGKRR